MSTYSTSHPSSQVSSFSLDVLFLCLCIVVLFFPLVAPESLPLLLCAHHSCRDHIEFSTSIIHPFVAFVLQSTAHPASLATRIVVTMDNDSEQQVEQKQEKPLHE
jgi:hypothetical protein